MPTVRTAETIESVSQPELLYSDLPNYANRPTEEWPGELLVKMAAQATAQAEAEAATQGHETAVALNKGSCANAGLREGLSHIDKKHAVGNGVDGPPQASATRVDAPEQTPKDDRAASFVVMECEDERNNSRSHAETSVQPRSCRVN